MLFTAQRAQCDRRGPRLWPALLSSPDIPSVSIKSCLVDVHKDLDRYLPAIQGSYALCRCTRPVNRCIYMPYNSTRYHPVSDVITRYGWLLPFSDTPYYQMHLLSGVPP